MAQLQQGALPDLVGFGVAETRRRTRPPRDFGTVIGWESLKEEDPTQAVRVRLGRIRQKQVNGRAQREGEREGEPVGDATPSFAS